MKLLFKFNLIYVLVMALGVAVSGWISRGFLQQQAVDEATAVVLAREQMFYDLLADPEPYLNQINDVTAQPQLDRDLRNLQKYVLEVAQGNITYESTGPVTITTMSSTSRSSCGMSGRCST